MPGDGSHNADHWGPNGPPGGLPGQAGAYGNYGNQQALGAQAILGAANSAPGNVPNSHLAQGAYPGQGIYSELALIVGERSSFD